jgi:DNA-binding PadR family transcriptional regulator
MHGYRIKDHIEQNFGHMWSINYGQIYPNLKKLYEDGLISMTEMNQNGEKGPTQLYSITMKGKRISRWLEESPEKPMLLRDPFDEICLLRFRIITLCEIIDNQIKRYENDLGA